MKISKYVPKKSIHWSANNFGGLILAFSIALPLLSGNQIGAQDDAANSGNAPGDADALASLGSQNNVLTYSNPVANNWQVGVQIRSTSASLGRIKVLLPLPAEWPEQTVTLVEEDVPPEVSRAKPRTLNSGVQQMYIEIRRVAANTLLELKWTYRVTTSQITAPKNPKALKIPAKIPRDAKEYTGTSPQISYRNNKLRKQVKEIVDGKESGWEQVRAIFDWVRENIEVVNGKADDSISVFRRKKGCAEDLVGLFVAMCRCHKVPARMVWVDGNQYAEFLLVDDQGKQHWIPCQVAGLSEFGSISEPRVILQKGDNIKVPEKEDRQKFAAEHVSCSGKSKPKVRFIRKRLPADQK